MVRGSSFTITTLRLKMNDIGKVHRWTEDDILNVCLYCEVVELTTLHCLSMSRNSNRWFMDSPGIKYSGNKLVPHSDLRAEAASGAPEQD